MTLRRLKIILHPEEVVSMKLLALIMGAAAGILLTAGAIALEPGGPAPSSQPAPQTIEIDVADSAGESRVTPANLAVRPDIPVTVTVYNHSRMAHTFTVRDLGVNQIILAGKAGAPSRTTFTFTPTHGVFRWYCAVPCGAYMGGHIYAIIGVPSTQGRHWVQTV